MESIIDITFKQIIIYIVQLLFICYDNPNLPLCMCYHILGSRETVNIACFWQMEIIAHGLCKASMRLNITDFTPTSWQDQSLCQLVDQSPIEVATVMTSQSIIKNRNHRQMFRSN